MNTVQAKEQLTGAQFTTYRIGGPIEEAYQPTSLEEAIDVLESAKKSGKPLTILGWGGNTIVASRGIPGITLITRKMDWIKELGNNQFEFGAGVHLVKAAKVAQRHALTGGEYMVGIPGTVGGAIRMNAGALGQETSHLVKSANVLNLETGEVEVWPQERFDFRYRHSAIDPTRHVVLSAVLVFQSGNAHEINDMMSKSITFRRTHHPTEPSGGSVFQNPSKEMTAGRMLDEAGAKEWIEGGVRISPLHANFIINLGNGTSTDVLRLMTRMKRTIWERHGLQVFPENLFLGDATPEEIELWKELTSEYPVSSPE